MARRSVLLTVLVMELAIGTILLQAGYLSRHPLVPELPALEV